MNTFHTATRYQINIHGKITGPIHNSREISREINGKSTKKFTGPIPEIHAEIHGPIFRKFTGLRYDVRPEIHKVNPASQPPDPRGRALPPAAGSRFPLSTPSPASGSWAGSMVGGPPVARVRLWVVGVMWGSTWRNPFLCFGGGRFLYPLFAPRGGSGGADAAFGHGRGFAIYIPRLQYCSSGAIFYERALV